MKKQSLTLALAAFFVAGSIAAQESTQQENKHQYGPKYQRGQQVAPMANAQRGAGFIDENGDGINDNAPDIDGDGIPNGQDPDFVRPQDGSGRMAGAGKGMRGAGNGGGLGTGVCDGSGSGAGTGSASCDGTGRKGPRGASN